MVSSSPHPIHMNAQMHTQTPLPFAAHLLMIAVSLSFALDDMTKGRSYAYQCKLLTFAY